MIIFFRGLIGFGIILILWQCATVFFNIPPYILPTPLNVFQVWNQHSQLLMAEALPTMIETGLGLLLGILLGCSAALMLAFIRPAARWLLPILIVSQAIPTFAIAPLLVMWFGFGMTSKIITTVIMLFFPITSAFFDGLRRTELAYLDLARTMQAKKWRVFWLIRIPSALPDLASGLRIAAVIAPIGAVIGEWVGASHGLGFLMLNANARMQIDLMFAALFLIVIFSLILYFTVDQLLKLAIHWQPNS